MSSSSTTTSTTTSLYGSRFNPSVTSLPRPRRPDPSTISYITSLPLDDYYDAINTPSTTTTNDVDDDDDKTNDDDDDDRLTSHPIFIASKNALESIANEIASLAGDEKGCLFLERTVRLAVKGGDGEMMMTLMEGVKGYAVHLASHRYGSHFLQTLLSSTNIFLRSSSPSKRNDETTNTTTTLQQTRLTRHVLEINDELLPYATDLAVHICGTHVVRTLLTVLGGVDISSSYPSPRDRGGGGAKKKKKKKKKPPQERDGRNVVRAADEKVSKLSYSSRCRASLTEGLTKLTRVLTYGSNDVVVDSSFDPGPSLREMICHVSAGPLYATQLAVLCVAFGTDGGDADDNETGSVVTKPIIAPSSPAHHFLSTAFSWSHPSSEPFPQIMFELIRHPVGSVFIERVFQYAPPSLHRDMLTKGGFHSPSQTIVTPAFHSAISHDVANFVIQTILGTLSTRAAAERVCRAVISDEGTTREMTTRRRRGVAWRVADCCARYNVVQERCLAVFFGDVDDGDNVSRIVRSWVMVRDGGATEGDATRRVDSNGARLVHALLRFVPRLSRKISSVVSSWDGDTLVFLAMDGVGSRYVIDGILRHEKVSTESSLTTAVRKLHERFKGSYVALATHRVGHHAVLKLFRLLNDERKEELVEELVAVEGGGGMRKLQSCAMGRSVAKDCLLGEFMIDKGAWRTQVKKLRETEDWLKDIVGDGGEETGGNGGADSDKTKKKRKRKRKAGKTATTMEGDADKDHNVIDDDNDDKSKPTTSSVVDSIVETLMSGRSSSRTMEGGVSMGGDGVASKRKRKRKRKKSGA